MYILGIDYGEKNIGLAYSRGELAVPTKVVHNVEDVVRFVAQHNIEKIVVGLPLNPEGKEGFQARKVRDFVKHLRVLLRGKVEIVYQNERFTTDEALRKLEQQELSKKKAEKKLDAVAAGLVLQDYLDAGRSDPAVKN